MKTSTICTLMGIAALATPAFAAPTLFATSGSYLYRIDLGNLDNGGLPQGVDTFQLDTALVSLTIGNDGELWGTERHDSSGDGNYAIYRIDDLLATPVMTQQGDFINSLSSSIVNINGTIHAFLDDTSEMVALDMDTDTYSVVGSFANLPVTPASSGYDAITNTSYGIRDTELFQFDATGTELGSTKVADLNFGGLTGPIGGEIVDGVYYHAIMQNLTMHIFAIDLITGVTEELVAFEVHEGGSLGLAGIPTVPTPGSAALLAMGSLMTMRRRR